MKFKKLLVLAFVLGALQGFAQESVNTSGGNASGATGKVSYTVGQTIYTTNIGATGSVAQGVQQAFDIQPVLGIDKLNINLQVAAYPNPTTNWLQLDIKNINLSTLSYQLFDVNGKVITTEKISCETSSISMAHLPTATYFLRVLDNNKEVKTFKIIKK